MCGDVESVLRHVEMDWDIWRHANICVETCGGVVENVKMDWDMWR